jgi:glucose/arabinose dehydrogenase
MKWLRELLDVLLAAEGRRKAIQTFGVLVALTGMAFYLKPTFAEYRDGVIVLLGLALGTHAYQTVAEAKAKATQPLEPIKP